MEEMAEKVRYASITSATLNVDRHKNTVLYNLNIARREKLFCDITLIAGDNLKIVAHRVVLMAGSNYFKSMFNSGMIESKTQTVPLSYFGGKILEEIVDFLYTGDIYVHDKNIELLLEGARYLQLDHLLDALTGFIVINLTESNWSTFLEIFHRYNYEDLSEKICQYICKNIYLICRTEDFLMLSAHYMKAVLSSDHINVISETELFFYLMDWIEYDRSERLIHLANMLPLIRLSQTNMDFILQHITPICNNNQLNQLITAAMSYLRYDGCFRRIPNDMPPNWLKKRQHDQRIIVLMDSHIKEYCFEKRTWKIIADVPDYHKVSSAMVADGNLYLIGGRGNVSKCDRFDLRTKQWYRIANMNHSRSYPGLAWWKNKLYAVGGYGITPAIDSLEAIINQVIPVFGLYSPTGLASGIVERYNPITNEWTELQSLPSGRYSSVLVPGNHSLYCLGGQIGGSPVDDVFAFHHNAWHTEVPLTCGRADFGAVFDNDEIFAIGGRTNNVERRNINGVTKLQTVPGSNTIKKCIIFENKIIGFGKDVVFECIGDRNTWRISESIVPLSGFRFHGAFAINARYFSSP